jgi:hypothetical protein
MKTNTIVSVLVAIVAIGVVVFLATKNNMPTDTVEPGTENIDITTGTITTDPVTPVTPTTPTPVVPTTPTDPTFPQTGYQPQ